MVSLVTKTNGKLELSHISVSNGFHVKIRRKTDSFYKNENNQFTNTHFMFDFMLLVIKRVKAQRIKKWQNHKKFDDFYENCCHIHVSTCYYRYNFPINTNG